ncbi:MAG: ABC transporter substrate-binding protein [Myxococcales bacterium]|jgi:ABC-type transporter MlaC component|nr:ABC transporter substrate-binding protein [Myxococcales bacterium]
MRKPFAIFAFCAALAIPSFAFAGDADAQAFVEKNHGKLMQLLEQPAGAARENAMQQELNGIFDFEELTRRIFGATCPTGVECKNHWATLTPAQQAEVTDLFRRLIEKTYKKNIERTKGFEVTYRGTREASSNEWKIRTEAKNKAKPRDPSVRIAYLVRATNGKQGAVDVEIENSSMVKNYNEQVSKMMTAPGQGYPYVVQRIKSRIAAP